MIEFKDGSRLQIVESFVTAYVINSNNSVITIDVGNKQYELDKDKVECDSWGAAMIDAGFAE